MKKIFRVISAASLMLAGFMSQTVLAHPGDDDQSRFANIIEKLIQEGVNLQQILEGLSTNQFMIYAFCATYNMPNEDKQVILGASRASEEIREKLVTNIQKMIVANETGDEELFKNAKESLSNASRYLDPSSSESVKQINAVREPTSQLRDALLRFNNLPSSSEYQKENHSSNDE